MLSSSCMVAMLCIRHGRVVGGMAQDGANTTKSKHVLGVAANTCYIRLDPVVRLSNPQGVA